MGLIRATVVAFAVVASAMASAQVQTVVSTVEDPLSAGGFWIGTYTLTDEQPHPHFPDGRNTIEVAQTFLALRNYSDISADVILSGSNTTHTIFFDIAIAAGDAPGPVLGTSEVTATFSETAHYQLSFNDISLVDGVTYWLIASSDAEADWRSGSLPVWRQSTVWSGDLYSSQNGGAWGNGGYHQSMAFAVYGIETGNPIDNKLPLPAGVVPEPSTYALLCLGLCLVGAAVRSKRGVGPDGLRLT